MSGASSIAPMMTEELFRQSPVVASTVLSVIRPLKSQGIREITNSVMVVRVKFTAKPGVHFIIRREAYRMITEALMAKGIYYAHRKVIVELPDGNTNDAADRKKIAEAGAAAAALASVSGEDQKTQKE